MTDEATTPDPVSIPIHAFGHTYEVLRMQVNGKPPRMYDICPSSIAVAFDPAKDDPMPCAFLCYRKTIGETAGWCWSYADGEPLYSGGDEAWNPTDTGEQATEQARAAKWDVFVLLPEGDADAANL